MKIISVVNQKGGCGKTVTAVNCAAALSKKGHKTLLIDLDPQAHASFSLAQRNPFTITDILERVCENNLPADMPLYSTVSDNFYFISSSIGLASLEQELGGRDERLQVLSQFLQLVAADFDFCILDCPPNLGIITLNALEASKYSLIPLTACDFSLNGAEILKDIFIMLKEFQGRSPAPFYLLTQLDKRSCFVREFIERVKSQLGELLLDAQIRSNIYLREAASAGKNIFEYKPESRGAEDFAGLAAEIERVTAKVSWAPLFLKAKDLSEVYVVGDFNNWQKQADYRLKKIGEDIWSINLALEKGHYRYKFLAGESWLADPYNKLSEKDPFGGKNSLLYVE